MKDCNNCKHKDCWEYADPCNSCTDVNDTREPTNWEAQTNADRIRGMTDEEIENWFWWMHKEMMRYTDSRVFLHDWLRQESE